MLFHSPTAVICYLVGLSLVFAGRVNVTIDDTYGDEHTGLPIAYTPTDYWKAGQDCTDCTARPDATRAHESTWRDGTFNLNNTEGTDIPVLQASVPFDGVAVYVYCILTGTYSSPDSYSQLNFVIDGETVGEFMHQPNGDGTYYYNVPVYVNESIPAGTHSLQIVNGQAGGKKSLVLLDYIVYTSVSLRPRTG
ncbi:hypothetical protein C8Q79DRAFT_897976 [Trametes meyenii]|nr:hypothetical protein C8Q79DRAFT_897976 [Trametes meyenii]